MINIRKLETDLWESADLLRSNSNLGSKDYFMPVLGLLFLRYAYIRFKSVENEILKDRPKRNGRIMPITSDDFKAKNALYLPKEARYDFLLSITDNITLANVKNQNGEMVTSVGEAINNAMNLIELESEQLLGILPKTYNEFQDNVLSELLRLFNNNALDDVGGDVIGRIYEYFLNKFAKNVASDDGVFFTPKSLVKMIVNVIEPTKGILFDPACGSGGMFVQTGDFINTYGINANNNMTFYGQEKQKENAQLCLMNMAVHGLSAKIKYGDEGNSFYRDAHNLESKCDYVMANPPFNVKKVKVEEAKNAGRLPFGYPGINKKTKEFSDANYLWISYFYAYLKDTGRAGFVMASSATDSRNKDKDIREKLIKTGNVDVIISVGNNFFYTLSLPCTLWFFNRNKAENLKDKILLIDAREYYTIIDRTLNEWSDWQLKNLTAIVWLYRGETAKYTALLQEYKENIIDNVQQISDVSKKLTEFLSDEQKEKLTDTIPCLSKAENIDTKVLNEVLNKYLILAKDYCQLAISKAKRGKKKPIEIAFDEIEEHIKDILITIEEYNWLIEKFADGKYKNIAGLCKIADLNEITQKDYSLTPGAYVGVAPIKDDGVDFSQRMKEIHQELLSLQCKSNELMNNISNNLEELGI